MDHLSIAHRTRYKLKYYNVHTRANIKNDQMYYKQFNVFCVNLKHKIEKSNTIHGNSKVKIQSILEPYKVMIQHKELLYLCGSSFCKTVIRKMNEFINYEEERLDFSNQMYEYKTKLLPYLVF